MRRAIERGVLPIPSVVKRWHLPYNVEVSDCIVFEEGAVLIVEALEEKGENHLFEFTSGSHPQSC